MIVELPERVKLQSVCSSRFSPNSLVQTNYSECCCRCCCCCCCCCCYSNGPFCTAWNFIVIGGLFWVAMNLSSCRILLTLRQAVASISCKFSYNRASADMFVLFDILPLATIYPNLVIL